MNTEISELRTIVKEILWMARRYANGRQTYAPCVVNRAINACEKIGIVIEDDNTLVEDGNSNPKYLDE